MKKRNILGVLSAMAVAATLVACGGGAKEATTAAPATETTASAQSEEATKEMEGSTGDKLTVAIWDNGQKPGLEEIIKDFTAETGVEAEIQVITWDEYWTLLEAGASGGDLPDVFWMHSNESQKYMSNGILMDLTDKIAASQKVEINKMKADIRGLYEYEGKTYAIPKDIDTIALWYNKSMFDEAGIEYPNENWTWDDFYDAAVKLTKEDGSQFGTAMNPSNNQDGWYNIVYSMGGKIISDDKMKSGMDDPNTVKAMEFVDKLRKDAMPSATVMSENKSDILLTSGKIAMLPQGSWMLAGFKENDYMVQNCDIAVLPKDATTGKRVSIYNGLGWAASANSKNPEGAWKLIEWFSSKEAQEKQAQLGVTMAAYEGVSDTWVKSTDKFNLDAYLFMLDKSDLVIRPSSRATVVWENGITSSLVEAWDEKITIQEACAKAAEQMNAHLAEE